jgi:hypothetical protein
VSVPVAHTRVAEPRASAARPPEAQ